MDNKLKDILFKKYPEILKKENLISDISCGDGWFWLIDNLCKVICSSCSNVPYILNVVQIKQKCSGLRFYFDIENPAHIVDIDVSEIYGMIRLAEHLSFSICEECGSIENIEQTKSGFTQTLCLKCRTKLGVV